MRRHIITGAVLLFLIGFFFINSGQAGCAPAPDARGILRVKSATGHDDDDHHNAAVYNICGVSSGFLGHLDQDGEGQFNVEWYSVISGNALQGMLLVVNTEHTSHTHEPYMLPKNGSVVVELKKTTEPKP